MGTTVQDHNHHHHRSSHHPEVCVRTTGGGEISKREEEEGEKDIEGLTAIATVVVVLPVVISYLTRAKLLNIHLGNIDPTTRLTPNVEEAEKALRTKVLVITMMAVVVVAVMVVVKWQMDSPNMKEEARCLLLLLLHLPKVDILLRLLEVEVEVERMSSFQERESGCGCGCGCGIRKERGREMVVSSGRGQEGLGKLLEATREVMVFLRMFEIYCLSAEWEFYQWGSGLLAFM